jgi:acyl carrier protein
LRQRICQILDVHARLPVKSENLGETENLYAAGMTSHASINLMLALEEEFDVEFPDAMLTRNAFQSVDAIVGSLTQLGISEESS